MAQNLHFQAIALVALPSLGWLHVVSMPLPIDLRGLIISFVLLAVLITLVSSFIVAYRVQREALIDSTLEANAAYAAKVASSISEFLDFAYNHLNYSAKVLFEHCNDPVVLRDEAVRLQEQDTDFNSIVIMDYWRHGAQGAYRCFADRRIHVALGRHPVGTHGAASIDLCGLQFRSGKSDRIYIATHFRAVRRAPRCGGRLRIPAQAKFTSRR